MRQIKFQKLRQEGLDAQKEAAEKFRSGQTDAALDRLQDYLAQLNDEQLDPGQLTLLRRPVESRLQQFKLLKSQQDFAGESARAHAAAAAVPLQRQRVEENKQKNVAKLMKEFNTLFREGKYAEAESLAMRAKEIDPDNGVATAAVFMARTQRRRAAYKVIKDGKEVMVVEGLNDAENEGPAGAIKDGISIDPERSEISRKRPALNQISLKHRGEKERDIERRLSTPVNLNFNDVPLKTVIDDLRAYQGINIYVDEPALGEEGVSLERPVSIKLEQVSLKSALNLLLHGVHLTYVIQDEVLQITTEARAKGKLVPVTYQVADLVIPIDSFGDLHANPLGAPAEGAAARPASPAPPPTPITGPLSLSGGTSSGTPSGTPSGGAFASAAGPTESGITRRGPSNTMEDMLIKLVTNTVAPTSWSEAGGPGTIDYYPLTMALVINQTPDIQEQVAELLAALRRLQDQEVAVEIRFITLAEDFFERVGVNFNLNIVTNDGRNHTNAPLLTSGQFAPPGFINSFQPNNFLTGLTPAGTFTSDLNIPITQQTYAQAIPPFGGYNLIPGFGGLTMGLAFLSDIQVFLFMEAVQGDTRTNVMQAPKLTLFNGQTATLNVTDQQFFVTNVQVLLQQGQFTFFPQNQPIVTGGVNLTMNAVISADRRFVRMSLNPSLTNLTSNVIPLMPIVVPIFPLFDGQATGQPVVFTQYVQQPVRSFISVQTTVAVPDGGTVLMGGLKRLSEGRNEYGPPVLSKIPYLNRLFKNVGYGRNTESLLLMVTPRIIVQTEEEERQTGVREPPPLPPL
jgi:type II secretory pathway component GspD/PulD (secretin)